MADYNNLKASIANVIKTNNRNEITGQILQNVLNQMVGVIGENYQLAGFANPLTNPGAPDQNIFYIADQGGTYTNFDNIVLDGGVSFLMWKNSRWSSHTINVVTSEWVSQNFVSIEYFRSLFRAYDEYGAEIMPNNEPDPISGDQVVVDSIKSMVGLWTQYYLSALGQGSGGGGGGGASALADLVDVQLTSPITSGQALLYNSTLGKWVNGTVQAGVDMNTVWSELAGSGMEQINISHLTGALADYATQTWVSNNFITVAYFDRLFRAYNGNTLVQHNDITSTIDNIKAMFGFWTAQYLSALGNSSGQVVSLGLSELQDVQLTTPVTNGQALVYNSTSLKWENNTISTVTALANLTDVLLTSPANEQFLMYNSTASKWVNSAIKTINGQSLIGSGDISVGSGASGNYLPLTGGTLTGSLQIYSTGNNYNEGLRMHVASDRWCGVVMCGSDNTGSTGTSQLSWGIHNHDGEFLIVNNGSTSYTRGFSWAYNGNPTFRNEGSLFVNSGTAGNVIELNCNNTYTAITYRNLAGIRTWVAGTNSDGFYFWNALNKITMTIGEAGSVNIISGGNVTIGTIGGSSTSAGAGYFSCGPGYSVNSGRYGLRFLVCDQSDAQSGLGQDLVTPTGYRNAYNLCVAGGRSSGGEGYISFVDHAVNSTTYTYLGGFVNNGGVKFQVIGSIYATGEITALSDVRYKDIQEYMTLDNDAVANAPVIRFLWKDRKNNDGLHVGSIAQYWEKVLPEAVKCDKSGTLSMSYGVVALVAAVSTAKKVQEHERRIADLERENKELKERLKIA